LFKLFQKTAKNTIIAPHYPTVADPDRAFGGAVTYGGAKKVFTYFKCQRLSSTITKKWLPFVAKKVNYAIFQGKALYINNSENVWRGVPKHGACFSQATHNRAHCWRPKPSLISTNCIKRYTLIKPEACCAQAFDTALAVQRSEKKQCLKRIPDLVRSRTVFLRLWSDNSSL